MIVVAYERAPKLCPNGHRLGPNRVVVGWMPCSCETAVTSSGAHGHRLYACSSCGAEVLIPPHTAPVRVGVQWPLKKDREDTPQDP